MINRYTFGIFDGYPCAIYFFSEPMNKSVLSIVRQITLLCVGGLFSASLLAQSDLPPVPLSQLSRPNGWQLVGSVSPTADGTNMRPQPGNNVLTGSGEPLTLITPTDDFRLHFEMMTSPNADVVLTLPTGQPVSLADSREMTRLMKAPGLWQTVDIWYKTGDKKGPAVLEKLALNSTTVRESITLSGNKSGPLTVMAKSGTLAIRNLGYRVMSPRQVAQWSSPVSYNNCRGAVYREPCECPKQKSVEAGYHCSTQL